MNENEQEDILSHLVSIGGAGGTHDPKRSGSVLAAPTASKEFNTLRFELTPAACVLLKNSRFEFDSSFVGPRAIAQMKFLAKLRKEQPGLVASVFGHADPTGNDDYNKQLSGRRAQAIYALLTRRTELWEDLYSHPIGHDTWNPSALEIILHALGHDSEEEGEDSVRPSRESVKAFQESAGLGPTGTADVATRKVLFQAYMDAICVDREGKPFQLDAHEDFLAHGVSKHGKGDYQGCGEFNPVLVFSKAKNNEFQYSPDKTARDEANKPNRRVMIFLFRKGSQVEPGKWPCPCVKDGVTDCRTRFYSDGDSRRSPQESQREYKDKKDTFACRFYDRFAVASPCETGAESPLRCHLSLLLRSNSGCVPLANLPYKVFVGPDRVLTGTTGPDGLVQHADVPAGDYKLEIEGHTTFVPATPLFRTRREHQVEDFFLFDDPDPFAPPPVDGPTPEPSPPELGSEATATGAPSQPEDRADNPE